MGSINKGILLLALGHPNYFKMAVNLAASIKYNDPAVSIALINDGTNEIDTRLFDHSIIFNEQQAPHTVKTRLYELTPYTHTLYLDVDMIMMVGVKPSMLIDELNGVPFTVMNVKSESCIWAEPAEVRKAAGGSEEPMYIYYSELMYFEKGEQQKKLFSEAKKQLKAKIDNKKFAGEMADELAFIISSMKLGIRPHKDNWAPVFWHFRNKKDAHLQPYKLKEKYIAYSIGGNETPQYAKANYNNLAVFYGQQMQIDRPYKVIDKRHFLPSRAKI